MIRRPEIERKYHIQIIPFDFTKYSCVKICQGYLTTPHDNHTLRLRKKEGRYYRTWKSKGHLMRMESETEITKEEFDKEWENIIGMEINKTRYEIPYKQNTIELDIYEGKLKGLMTAEVEFKSLHESTLFIAPDWFGEEVTNDPDFRNSSLAYYGLPKRFLVRNSFGL